MSQQEHQEAGPDTVITIRFVPVLVEKVWTTIESRVKALVLDIVTPLIVSSEERTRAQIAATPSAPAEEPETPAPAPPTVSDEAIQAAIAAAPALGDEPGGAECDAAPTPHLSILGPREEGVPVEEVVPQPTGATPTPPATPEPPVATPETKAPGSILAGLNDLAARSQASTEAFHARLNEARGLIVDILGAEKLMVKSDAEFVDLATDYVKRALTWLSIQVAKGLMTVEEAVAYARNKPEWLEEVDVRPDIYRALMAEANNRGVHIKRFVRVNGEDTEGTNVQAQLGLAIESGETTVEGAVNFAIEHGWTKPLNEEVLTTVGKAMLEARTERSEEPRNPKKGGNRGKHRK